MILKLKIAKNPTSDPKVNIQRQTNHQMKCLQSFISWVYHKSLHSFATSASC